MYLCLQINLKSVIIMEHIKQLISDGQTDEALQLIEAIIAQQPENDEAWYLRGNAYRKQQDVRMALNSYLKAMELNPDSPARQAHNMLIDILNFYNKDMYNQ